MYRVTLPDGTRRRDKWLKVWRVTAYALMALAGLLLLFSPLLAEELGYIAVAMSGFLLVGGLSSMIGAITERWAGEFMGIPLLSSSFAVFGIISTIGAINEAPFVAGANFCLLIAVSATLFARWREVKAVYRMTVHLGRGHE